MAIVSLPLPYQYANGQTIDASQQMANLNQIANNVNANALAADGSVQATNALPMNGQRITSLGAVVASADAVNANDVQSGRLIYLTSVAGTNTITATAPFFPGYTAGQTFRFIPVNTSTGTATLNINAGGAKNIFSGGAIAPAGALIAGIPVEVFYDGTQFHLLSASSRLTPTALVTASGATVDFTGLPSWARRITLMFDGVSFTGTDFLLLQLGGSAGIETSGYATSFASTSNGVTPSVTERTDSWALQSNSAAGAFTGLVTIGLLDPSTNKWVASGNIARGAGLLNVFSIAGSKALATALQRVRLSASGTNTFDAGTVSLLYE
jgi:hypothetical protein